MGTVSSDVTTTAPQTYSKKTPSLSDIELSPYFTGPLQQAMLDFTTGQWDKARLQFEKNLPQAQNKAYVQLLIALCNIRARHWTTGAQELTIWLTTWTDEPYVLLHNYIHYQAAIAYIAANDSSLAQQHIQKIEPSSRYFTKAKSLHGEILRKTEQWEEAILFYKTYQTKAPLSERTNALFYLAQSHQKQKHFKKAARLYRKILWKAPLHPFAKKAKQELNILYKKHGISKPKPTAINYINRGTAYFQKKQNEKAIRDFQHALQFSLSNKQRCKTTYRLAYSWWRKRKRNQSAPLFDKAWRACKNNLDLRVKASYQAGRSYFILGKYKKAIIRFQRIESEPHSYADDARILRAELEERLGNNAKVLRILASIPKDFPNGDMATEAIWRLAWRHYKQGNQEKALYYLTKQEQRNYHKDQALYWRGHIYTTQGKAKDAIDAYSTCIRNYPLTYYALLALQQLEQHYPQTHQTILKEIQYAPANDKGTPFHFKPRAVYSSRTFLRGIEFLRLGLSQEATQEFIRSGMHVPSDRKYVANPDRQDALWAMASIFDRLQQYSYSHWVTRWHITNYKREWPNKDNQKYWKIAYPLAYRNLLTQAAQRHQYPAALPTSIMREESAFSAIQTSWANAFGLMQLILPTAKRFQKYTDTRVTRQTLYDPEVNIDVAAGFLAYLWSIFQGHVGLIVPSYNAGERRITQWLQQRGNQHYDAWLEDAPIDETRNYTKRVLSSYFAYSYLYQGVIPRLPLLLSPRGVKKPASKRN